jgi:hypothetical protein
LTGQIRAAVEAATQRRLGYWLDVPGAPTHA